MFQLKRVLYKVILTGIAVHYLHLSKWIDYFKKTSTGATEDSHIVAFLDIALLEDSVLDGTKAICPETCLSAAKLNCYVDATFPNLTSSSIIQIWENDMLSMRNHKLMYALVAIYNELKQQGVKHVAFRSMFHRTIGSITRWLSVWTKYYSRHTQKRSCITATNW